MDQLTSFHHTNYIVTCVSPPIRTSSVLASHVRITIGIRYLGIVPAGYCRYLVSYSDGHQSAAPNGFGHVRKSPVYFTNKAGGNCGGDNKTAERTPPAIFSSSTSSQTNATRICKRKWPHDPPTRHQHLNASKIKGDPPAKVNILIRFAFPSGKSVCDRHGLWPLVF